MKASVISKDTLSFTIAASIVTTLLQLAGITWPAAPTSFWWALSTSAAVGALILLVQWERPAKPEGGAHWFSDLVQPAVAYVGLGLLNILVVTAAVLGVGSAVEDEPVTTPLGTTAASTSG